MTERPQRTRPRGATLVAGLALTLGLLVVGACSRTGLLEDRRTLCVEGQAELTRAYPTAIFVIDRSESMTEYLSGSSISSTRWGALRQALTNTLPSIDESVQLGAMLMPASSTTGTCYVNQEPDIEPELNNVSRVIDLINGSDPGGATPTNSAIRSAAEALLKIQTSSSARALVLATDGGPDCNGTLDSDTCRCTEIQDDGKCASASKCLDDKRTIKTISEYAHRGVPTYVIGIESPGDSAYSDVLDAMAEAGGRPQPTASTKYYRVSSQSELDGALAAITAQVGACVFLSSSVPDLEGSIVLALDGKDLTPDQWSWQDREHGEIKLAPSICAQVAEDTNPVLLARVVCGSP